MKKALIVGFAVLVWAPFLYREWTREPARAPTGRSDLDGRTAEELLEQIDGPPAPPPPEETEPEEPEDEPEPEADEPEAPEPEVAQAPAEVEVPAPSGEAPAEGEAAAEAEKPPFLVPPSGPVPVLSKAFEGEVRDALWASSRERALHGVMTGAGLPAEDLDEVRCQRTVCKIELHTTKASNELYPDVFKALHEQFGAELGVLPQPAKGEDEQLRVVLYTLRPGYKLSDLGE